MRSGALFAYCHSIKLKFPDVIEAVGIASEPVTEEFSSQDFMYVELSPDMFDANAEAKWREAMAELDVLQSSPMNLNNWKSQEFPTPFDFSTDPGFVSIDDGTTMNRKARRAMAKKARKRSR